MLLDRKKLYSSAKDFFILKGSIVMKLTPDAALDVCECAAVSGLVIARVEGGIWHFPGFEARLDCIWDGISPPVNFDVAERNNTVAADFIRTERAVHDAFIITAPSLADW